jgi:hypothetical protein
MRVEQSTYTNSGRYFSWGVLFMASEPRVGVFWRFKYKALSTACNIIRHVHPGHALRSKHAECSLRPGHFSSFPVSFMLRPEQCVPRKNRNLNWRRDLRILFEGHCTGFYRTSVVPEKSSVHSAISTTLSICLALPNSLIWQAH